MSETKFLIFSAKKPALPIAFPVLLTGSFLLVIQDKNQGHHPDSSFSHLTSSPPANPVDLTFKMRLGSDHFPPPLTTATLISLNYCGRFLTDLCTHSCPSEGAPKSAGRVILFKHRQPLPSSAQSSPMAPISFRVKAKVFSMIPRVVICPSPLPQL